MLRNRIIKVQFWLKFMNSNKYPVVCQCMYDIEILILRKLRFWRGVGVGGGVNNWTIGISLHIFILTSLIYHSWETFVDWYGFTGYNDSAFSDFHIGLLIESCMFFLWNYLCTSLAEKPPSTTPYKERAKESHVFPGNQILYIIMICSWCLM